MWWSVEYPKDLGSSSLTGVQVRVLSAPLLFKRGFVYPPPSVARLPHHQWSLIWVAAMPCWCTDTSAWILSGSVRFSAPPEPPALVTGNPSRPVVRLSHDIGRPVLVGGKPGCRLEMLDSRQLGLIMRNWTRRDSPPCRSVYSQAWCP